MNSVGSPTDWEGDATRRRTRARHAADRRFRLLAGGAVALSLGFLLFLLATMLVQGASGFRRTMVRLPVDVAAARLAVTPAQLASRGADLILAGAGLDGAVDRAATAAFGPGEVIGDGAARTVGDALKADPGLLHRRAIIWVPAASAVDIARKRGTGPAVARTRALARRGVIATRWNWPFLAGADATDPTRLGIWGALKGSILLIAVTLALAGPVGVLAALYLEEYAPRNRWTDLLEVSINNLAAVPSIIFGLLGLAVLIGALGLPRSSPLVGGLTLALMTMPIIVIAGRAAIQGVPTSVREAALGIGASRTQLVFHHILPLALPGMITGGVLGAARALGETAPLLLIGMRAFIAAPPAGVTAPATALPVQIFLWSDAVDAGFVEKTSAAILVLLALLIAINTGAIALRNRFEARR